MVDVVVAEQARAMIQESLRSARNDVARAVAAQGWQRRMEALEYLLDLVERDVPVQTGRLR